MCDYSLHGIASRPAEVGDHLITTTFQGTRGFCAAGKPKVAVCLLPGTELAFKAEARRQSLLGRLLPKSRFGKRSGTVARFQQINKDQSNTHCDALEFANGTIVLLTDLRRGQHATVLQLPPKSLALKEATDGERLGPAL